MSGPEFIIDEGPPESIIDKTMIEVSSFVTTQEVTGSIVDLISGDIIAVTDIFETIQDLTFSPETIVDSVSTQPSIIEVLQTGPQGPPGPSVQVSLPAGETISGDNLVVIVSGLVYKADPTNFSHGTLVGGIASNSATIGNSVTFLPLGRITGGSFSPNAIYFAGLAGVLSTTPIAPGAVWTKLVGFGQDNNDLIVEMGPTYYL